MIAAIELPWLKFIPLGVAFTITLCEALSRKTERKWFHRFFVPVLSAVALGASCWIVWSDDKSAREGKTGENIHFDRIEGKLGSEEATNRYLDVVKNLKRQLTAAKTGNSVDKFFSSKDEREKLRDQVNEANRRLLLNYEIKMNPVREYIVSKFDSWISGIQKRGIKVDVATGEIPTVSIGIRKIGSVRNVTFETGDKVELNVYSAVVQDGRLNEVLLCRIMLNSARGTAPYQPVASVQVEEKTYRIDKPRERFAYKQYTGESDNPIEDKEFIAALDQALDETMSFVIEEAAAPK